MSFRQNAVTVIPSQNGLPNVRFAHTLAEELRVIERAKSVGFAQQAAMFKGTPKFNMQRWIAQLEKLEDCVKELIPSEKKQVHKLKGGRKPLFGEDVEEKLFEYYCERHEKLLIVTQHLPMAHWWFVNPIGLKDVSETAALQRIKWFMDWNGLANRKKTHVAQKKKTTKEEIKDFVSHMSWKKDMLGIANDDAIVNADETNAHFSHSFEGTIVNKGTKTFTIAEPNSSNWCTAMLGCSLSRRKLPPYIIF